MANILMLTGPLDQSMINVILFDFTLPSEHEIIVTISDALIVASIFSFYMETLKATRTSVMFDYRTCLVTTGICGIPHRISLRNLSWEYNASHHEDSLTD